MAATARGVSSFGGGGQATQRTWSLVADWRLPSNALRLGRESPFATVAGGRAGLLQCRQGGCGVHVGRTAKADSLGRGVAHALSRHLKGQVWPANGWLA